MELFELEQSGRIKPDKNLGVFPDLLADLAHPDILTNLLLDLATAGLCLANLAGSWGRFWWGFELFSHFRVQYLVLAGIVTFIAATQGRTVPLLVGGLLTIWNLSAIHRFYVRTPSAFASGPAYRLLLLNVLQENTHHTQVLELIRSNNPDLVILLEVDQGWLDALEPITRNYPFYYEASHPDHFGLALYSRLPMTQVEAISEDKEPPSVIAKITERGSSFTLIATHPWPPKRKWMANLRNLQMERLARFVASYSNPTILAGDFNTTSWSPFFKDWLLTSRLHDSRIGFGIQSTWPASNPILRIPIDHILVSPQISVRQRQVGPAVGSDHLPVILDFSIKGSSQ